VKAEERKTYNTLLCEIDCARHMKYNYDHAQGNNSSTIRDLSVLECIGEYRAK
jgi:hypothetical protein